MVEALAVSQYSIDTFHIKAAGKSIYKLVDLQASGLDCEDCSTVYISYIGSCNKSILLLVFCWFPVLP